MKPEDDLLSGPGSMDFMASMKLKTDEELLSAYVKANDEFSPEFMDLIKDELGLRGYPVDEIDSWDTAQALLLKRNSDEELFDMHQAKGVDPRIKEMIRKEMDKRKLSLEILKEEKKKKAKKETGMEFLLFNMVILSGWLTKYQKLLDGISQVYKQEKLTALNMALVSILGFMIIVLAGTLFLLHARKFDRQKLVARIAGYLIYFAAGISTIFGMVSVALLNSLLPYLYLILGLLLYTAAYFLIFNRKQSLLI